MTIGRRKPLARGFAVGAPTEKQLASVSRFVPTVLRRYKVGPVASAHVVAALRHEVGWWVAGVPMAPAPRTGGQPPGYKDEILAGGVLRALAAAQLPVERWSVEVRASLAVDLEVAVRRGLGLKPRKSKVVGPLSEEARARSGATKRLSRGANIVWG
jgi:hypothetical protein